MEGSARRYGPVAQLGARLNGIQEVTGSIPVRSTTLRSRLTPPRDSGWQATRRVSTVAGEAAKVDRRSYSDNQSLELRIFLRSCRHVPSNA
jgi:hypothetical protein